MAVACVTEWFCALTIVGSTLEAVTQHSNLMLKKTVWSLSPATSPEVRHYSDGLRAVCVLNHSFKSDTFHHTAVYISSC